MHNAEVVEAMGMRPPLFKLWIRDYLKSVKSQEEASSVSALYTNLSKMFRMLFSSLTYGLGAVLSIAGLISPGMIIAGAVLLGRALAPISQLVATWKNFISAKNAYKRLNDLLADFPPPQKKIELPPPKGEIEVNRAVVVPPSGKLPVLKDVTLKIDAGDLVGVIGPSGAGKSSLAKTLLGIWKPVMGEVRLDGAEIFQYDRDKLGRYLGYLPQDIELFEGTIAQNIARFGEVEDAKVVEAARLAGVHDMIVRFPDGYNTKIGPGGMTLSGGQRQLIGLARAVFDTPALVVLDEPNSNLDDAGENALIHALLKLKEAGSTVVFITHKVPILKISDKIVLLRDGTVALYGSRDEVFSIMKQQ
jgi:ATP-binding cassette subfamily C protein EexD